MTNKQKQRIEIWLDDHFELALDMDKRMGNEDKDNFLPNNPNYIYYKGACDMLLAAGYDFRRTGGKHTVFIK